ncbi:thyrotropin-releasing hormone receptor isoform X6 [Magallana gigas]|uniref:thyrotropin-releasing hormone receptor isoform X6 n=1 Tax=Magallana gigas TaxID=29159 RepID=UPI00148A540E|nr:thyrotropin-releasing hormone receptor isoform X6 [Crassostrea gigas]
MRMDESSENVTLDTRAGPSLEYTVMAVGLPLVIFIIGFAGNILVITVILKRRSLQTPTNCYLLSLCVADCILLISSNLPTIPEPLLRAEDWPYGSFMCTLCVFLGYLGANVSSLSIGAFTVERYIGICHSLKAQTICTVSRARRILFVLWTLAILYCSPWLALAKVVPHTRNGTVVQSCTYTLERYYYGIYYVFDFVVFYVVPLVLSSVLYFFMIRLLLKDGAPRSTEHRSLQPRNRGAAARMQVVRMLIVIVVLFGTLWLPYRIVVVYNSFQDSLLQFKDSWFWLFCRNMVFINSAINPIVYNMLSVKFRRAFRDIVYNLAKREPSTSLDTKTRQGERGVQ